jgi:hypothetical protein
MVGKRFSSGVKSHLPRQDTDDRHQILVLLLIVVGAAGAVEIWASGAAAFREFART